VQVHYDEGIANRIGPEPCAGIREDVGEASAGEPPPRKPGVALMATTSCRPLGHQDRPLVPEPRMVQSACKTTFFSAMST
jgi:hypothetical protein